MTTTNNRHRLQVVDALRGFALLGIILAHYNGWHAGYSLPNELYQKFQHDVASQIVWNFDSIFVSGKFFSFFAYLFGVSFGLMFVRQRLEKWSFTARFAWRLTILGLIGLVHHLHWRGDILSIYAIVGFGLLLFQRASDKVILIVGLLLVINMPIRLKELYEKLNPPKGKVENIWETKIFPQSETIRYYQVIQSKSYTALIEDNARAFDNKMLFQVYGGRLFITFGFFLLGFWTSRRRLFEFFDENRPFFRKILWATGLFSLAFVASGITIYMILNIQNNNLINTIFGSLFDVLNAALTLFYVAGMAFLFQKKRWEGIASRFADIGKMALTSYLSQTVLGILIFFDLGLGLMGKVSPAVGYLIGISVFILQMFFSRWWLKHYYYGPVEWLWRSLTYFKAQPMRKG